LMTRMIIQQQVSLNWVVVRYRICMPWSNIEVKRNEGDWGSHDNRSLWVFLVLFPHASISGI
jgi:hypothetical protein